jgi:hypothetical protein
MMGVKKKTLLKSGENLGTFDGVVGLTNLRKKPNKRHNTHLLQFLLICSTSSIAKESENVKIQG